MNINNLNFTNNLDMLKELENLNCIIGLRYMQSNMSKLLIILKEHDIYCFDVKTSIIELLYNDLQIRKEIYLTIPINDSLLFIADKNDIAIISGTFNDFKITLPFKRLLLINLLRSSNDKFFKEFAKTQNLSLNELKNKYELLNSHRALLEFSDIKIIPIIEMLSNIF